MLPVLVSATDSIIRSVEISAEIEDNQSNGILNFSCPLCLFKVSWDFVLTQSVCCVISHNKDINDTIKYSDGIVTALPVKGSNSFYTFPAVSAALLIHLNTSCHIHILTPRAFSFPPFPNNPSII